MSHLSRDQTALNSSRIDSGVTCLHLGPDSLSDLTRASDWALSLCVDHPRAPSSLREGAPLAALPVVASAPHSATQQHSPEGHIISANVHAPAPKPPTPLIAADFDRIFHPFSANDEAYPVFREVDGGRHGCRPMLDVMHVSGIQIGVNLDAPYPGHRPTPVRKNPLLSHYGPAEEVLGPLSLGILRDADLLLSRIPNILDKRVLYGSNYIDMIRSNRVRINESVITCQWGACGDHVKVKNIKIHLKRKHNIEHNSKSYKCCWHGCFSRKSMTQLSTLVRHIAESHGSVHWHCPTCRGSFTRDETLSKHVDKCPGASTGEI